MANIVIKDLERNEALDKSAMQNLTGGLSVAGPGPWGGWGWGPMPGWGFGPMPGWGFGP